MKTPVAVTLIIMGTLLVMTPVFADFFHQRNTVELLAQPNTQSVILAGTMSELYRFGCWLTGSAMVGVVVLSSFFGRSRANEPDGLPARGITRES